MLGGLCAKWTLPGESADGNADLPLFDRYIQMQESGGRGDACKIRTGMVLVIIWDTVIIAVQFICCLSVFGYRESILGSSPPSSEFARICRSYGWDVVGVVSFSLNYVNVMLILVIRMGKICGLWCVRRGAEVVVVPERVVIQEGNLRLGRPSLAELRPLSGREFAMLPIFRYVGGRIKDEEKEVNGGGGSDRCSICYEEYVKGDTMTALSCCHQYHRVCVKRWLTSQRNSCPECCVLALPGEDRKCEGERVRDGTRSDGELAAAIALSIADLGR